MPATKDQIADVFERHVERFGLQKATVEDVAAELRISKKTIYEHFSSKRDLYAYVIARLAEQSRVQLVSALDPLPTFGEKAEALMRIVLATARGHIAETSRGDWEQEYMTAADAFMAALNSVLREVVDGGIGAGEFTFPDAAVAERVLGKMVLEYVLMVREEPSLDVDADLGAAVRRFLG